ncbi:MAG: cyclodeaminase/cyclohydrolase family protein [Elusimicrobiota bacterium]
MSEQTRPGWAVAADGLVAAFASTDPTPGGGAAAGTVGALGCALGGMATGISSRSKKIDEARRADLLAAREAFESLRAELQRLTLEDAAVFDDVMAAYRLPKDSPGRREKIQEALKAAAEVPLETARTAAHALERVRAEKERTVGTVASDMDCAVHLLRAAAFCALVNVGINTGSLKDPESSRPLDEEAEEIRKALG